MHPLDRMAIAVCVAALIGTGVTMTLLIRDGHPLAYAAAVILLIPSGQLIHLAWQIATGRRSWNYRKP